MYDSPLTYCPVCTTWIALDQAQRECAEKRQCGRGRGDCPLTRFFAVPTTQQEQVLAAARKPRGAHQGTAPLDRDDS